MSLFTRALGLSVSTRAAPVSALVPPKGALSMPQYQLPNQPIRTELDNPNLLRDNYYSVYVYSCVNTLANSIAGCPFRAGNQINSSFNIDAALAQLLGPAPGSPNDFFSAATLWRYSIIQRLMLGKFAWAIGRDSLNRINGLYPLMAQFLRPVPAQPGSTELWQRFEYGNKANKGYTEYSPDDIFYSWRPSQEDYHLPESVLQAAGIHIANMHLQDRFDYAFLKNGGVPAGMLVTPTFESKEEKDGFDAKFASMFSGVDNANRTMIAEREVVGGEGTESPDAYQWVQFGVNQRDSEANVFRDAKIRDITAAFHVPLSILGDSTLSKFQNAPEDRRNYWLEACKPIMRELQDDINTYLAPKLGRESGWFDTSEVPELAKIPILPQDGKATGVQVGILYTADEWRAERGLAPLPKSEIVQPPIQVSSTVGTASTPILDGEVVPPSTAPALSHVGSRSIDLKDVSKIRKELRHAGPDHFHVKSGHINASSTADDKRIALQRIFQDHLANFKAEQHRSLESIKSGARGRKAQANYVETFERGNWVQRGIESLSPILRELDHSEGEIVELVKANLIEVEDVHS